jgi:DNA modification methylase
MLELRPIVVNDDMIALGGNMRLKALEHLGIEETYIIKAKDLTDKQEQEFIIKDNVGYGEWDWDQLANEWDVEDLDEWGLDLPLDFVKELEAEEDDFAIPEDGIETDIVLGDLFEIGEHRLLCGDSTDSDAVAKLMNGEKAELLFTSPPYSDMREYNGQKDLSVDNLAEFIPTWMPFVEYQVVNLGIQRKENDIVSYWDDYIKSARNCGYKLLAWNVWHKSSVSVGQQSAFIPIYHEWIFVFGTNFKDINRTWERESEATNKNKRKVRQADGSMKESSIGFQGIRKEMESVFYSNVELGEIRSKHPATFPIELPTEYIKAITNENQIIAESFTGSGSTMVASHQLKRKCFGMELDPKYCQVIIDRMRNLDPTLVIKRNGQII